VTIRVLASAADPAATAVYARLLRARYTDFGVQAAMTVSQLERDGNALVLAEDGGHLVGGLALFAESAGPLPLTRYVPAGLLARLASPVPRVELCGIWTAQAWRATGLSAFLMQAAVAALAARGVERMVGVGHTRVIALYDSVGLVRVPEAEGFAFPDARYTSYLLQGAPTSFAGVAPGAMAELAAMRDALAAGSMLVRALHPQGSREADSHTIP